MIDSCAPLLATTIHQSLSCILTILPISSNHTRSCPPKLIQLVDFALTKENNFDSWTMNNQTCTQNSNQVDGKVDQEKVTTRWGKFQSKETLKNISFKYCVWQQCMQTSLQLGTWWVLAHKDKLLHIHSPHLPHTDTSIRSGILRKSSNSGQHFLWGTDLLADKLTCWPIVIMAPQIVFLKRLILGQECPTTPTTSPQSPTSLCWSFHKPYL
jgi:hypothetical protein